MMEHLLTETSSLKISFSYILLHSQWKKHKSTHYRQQIRENKAKFLTQD